MDANWLDIVKEALQLAIGDSGAAVTGAKLRATVARIAQARSLEFPPQELKKFANFIQSYPQFFEIRRRPGHDILIAPQGSAELFKKEEVEPAQVKKRFRADIFDALTKIFINGKCAFYVPATDSILWLDKKVGAPPSTAIAFPEHSTKAELDVRRQFYAAYDGDHKNKEALALALNTETELKPFTDAIHSHGLIEKWHAFRFDFLETKLRTWAQQNELAWRPEWIIEDTTASQSLARSAPAENIKDRQQLLDFCGMLRDEDLPRISIPLDVVLRLLASK